MAERAETLEKKPSRLFREIAEMASAQRRLGIMDEASYEKSQRSEAQARVGAIMLACKRVGNPPPAAPTALDN